MKLWTNKAAGLDSITLEHVINSHPAIAVHLKLLFTMMMTLSFVPSDFATSVIIPLVKNKHGDINATDNYRPITLSPVISKIFESILLEKYGKFMNSGDLQYGFKVV